MKNHQETTKYETKSGEENRKLDHLLT